MQRSTDNTLIVRQYVSIHKPEPSRNCFAKNNEKGILFQNNVIFPNWKGACLSNEIESDDPCKRKLTNRAFAPATGPKVCLLHRLLAVGSNEL